MEHRDEPKRATVETIKGDTHDAFDEIEARVRTGAERTLRAIRGGDADTTTDYNGSARDERDDEGGI